LNVKHLPRDQRPWLRYENGLLLRNELGVKAPGGNKQFAIIIFRGNSWWHDLQVCTGCPEYVLLELFQIHCKI
jgi:hypothetical protein